MKEKFSVGIWAFGACSERYVGEGYKDPLPLDERLSRLAANPMVKAVELNYPNDLNEENLQRMNSILNEHRLNLSALNVELVCERRWRDGSFTSFDEKTRRFAIERSKAAMRIAAQADCKTVNLWLGLDGFDYAFEADYARAWEDLREGIREIALSRPEVRLGLEYKISEPKMRCYLNSSGKALALALASGCENVGVTLDFGHALNANENPAEAAAVLMQNHRLFHVHINDNYAVSDDDMPAGAAHWPQFFEFIWWLKRMNYDGWISADIYPYRDDAEAALEMTGRFLALADRVADEMPVEFYDGRKAKSQILLRLLQIFEKGKEQ